MRQLSNSLSDPIVLVRMIGDGSIEQRLAFDCSRRLLKKESSESDVADEPELLRTVCIVSSLLFPEMKTHWALAAAITIYCLDNIYKN